MLLLHALTSERAKNSAAKRARIKNRQLYILQGKKGGKKGGFYNGGYYDDGPDDWGPDGYYGGYYGRGGFGGKGGKKGGFGGCTERCEVICPPKPKPPKCDPSPYCK